MNKNNFITTFYCNIFFQKTCFHVLIGKKTNLSSPIVIVANFFFLSIASLSSNLSAWTICSRNSLRSPSGRLYNCFTANCRQGSFREEEKSSERSSRTSWTLGTAQVFCIIFTASVRSSELSHSTDRRNFTRA